MSNSNFTAERLIVAQPIVWRLSVQRVERDGEVQPLSGNGDVSEVADLESAQQPRKEYEQAADQWLSL